MKLLTATIALLLIATTAALPSQAYAQAGEASAIPEDAEQLLSLTNQDRAADGLGPLKWDAALAGAARAHAELMVEHATLEHQFPGEPDVPARAGQAGAHFRSIAENIALGPNATDIERQWMRSVQHRTNILDPQMNSIGIALLRSRGELYAVEDFAAGVDSYSPVEVESRVSELLRAAGVATVRATEDARQTCEMPHGTAGGSQPSFVMRWEGPEVSRLPDALLQHLRGGKSGGQKFASAAVGACGSGHPRQGFTTYRVAVLLY